MCDCVVRVGISTKRSLLSKSGHDERAKQDLETKWTSGGHGQSIGLPSVVKAVIHCHTETFLRKLRELVNKLWLKYAPLHHIELAKSFS